MADQVDVVIIGAGLAGLAAAYHLAEAGIETIVVERGDFPGSKNVSGGRLYLNPVRPYFPPDFWKTAPFERSVVKEKLSILAQHASTTIEFCDDKFRDPPHSVTILRAPFDQWLAEKASEKGALIIPRNKVEDVISDNTGIVGVRTNDAELRCQCVIVADGVLSFIAEKAKLRTERQPHHYALGVKEIIELPAKTIEDRFGVSAGEGAAHLFFGSITDGMVGGGFLYTNRESLSLGMVVGIQALMHHEPRLPAPDLIERFKARPEIAPLLEGSNLIEYSAHVIPEGGIHALPKLFDNGIMLVGDAAGLGLNLGITVRGMDFALVSGALAARTIIEARRAVSHRSPLPATALAAYEQALRRCFVLQDLQTFAAMPALLENRRMYNRYPAAIAHLCEQVFWVGDQPKDKLSSTMFREAWKAFGNLDALKDALGILRV